MNFKLIIKKGPSPGQVIEVTRQEFIIGRETGADLVISSPVVSRRHARILQVDDGHTIEDLSSSNGTYVNDQQVVNDVWLKSGVDSLHRLNPTSLHPRRNQRTSQTQRPWSP
jgi:pSer/pThr/pTyr-binding forkhead associated (FHA) protein